jgi:two-component system chemotaxis sensor kinase CheA
MTALDLQLSESIEQTLNLHAFDRSCPQAPASLTLLSALTSQFLQQPLSQEMRPLVVEIAALATKDAIGPEEEARFRSGLQSLLEAFGRQKQLEATTSQFADDPEMIQEFIVEARDHLATVETGLLLLEREPNDGEALHSVFRSFHSIKGLAAFLGAPAIQELAHETESVLDLARSGEIALTPGIIDLILRSADDLTKCLNLATTSKLDEIPRRDPELLSSLGAVSRQEYLTETSPVEACEVQTPVRASVQNQPQENVLRVDASKLEYLIDMVGELVIAESIVRNDPAVLHSQEPLLSRNLKQLTRVVQEVQRTSMSMRMVSVGTLFRKMNRLIRDLSRKSGKIVELVTSGDDVELDRSIVEALADPMVHMIRNSMDHGLETPEERAQAGKNEQGTVRLKATHEAGDIVIELADDGRGLDAAKILSKARRLGLVGEQEEPDEDAVFRLIFEPGFSTAEKVTDLSGRGVGMDVVKKQIQKLRGRIAIRSVRGQSCTFLLRLPLTLAIIDGLVVGVGAQRYILPMFAVREMFSPGPDTFVTLENRVEAALFRDKLLPVIRLSRLLEKREADRRGGVLIVAEGRDQLHCIAVDQLIGKQEIVIKSLGNTYRDIPAIAGGSILGDGRVGLIIDVNALRYQD